MDANHQYPWPHTTHIRQNAQNRYEFIIEVGIQMSWKHFNLKAPKTCVMKIFYKSKTFVNKNHLHPYLRPSPGGGLSVTIITNS